MTSLSRFCTLLAAAFLLGIAFNPASTQAQDAPFITVWDTENSGETANDQIKIPGSGADYQIIWEEVGNTSNTDTLTASGDVTITFPNPGVYRVKISGNFTRIHFGREAGGDAPKILEVTQWGDIEWATMEEAFTGPDFEGDAVNLDISAQDTPDLSDVSSMARMFEDASSLTALDSNIGQWDVSSVTDMQDTFYGATSFNGDIGPWDVSSVTNMARMFAESVFESGTSFNQADGTSPT